MSSIRHIDAFKGQHPRFFNQNVDSLQKDLQKYVKMMGKRLKKRNNIEHYTYNLQEAGTDEVYVYGRIYAGFQDDDPTEKLTEKNAEIHFISKFENVPYLKIDYQKDVIDGLFRGQIIAARGTVDTNVFHASQIFTDCRTSNPTILTDDFNARIIAVSGPYDFDTFEPLDELNAKIKSYKPDLVIFFGPFASQTCKQLTSKDCKYTAQELTEEVMNHLGNGIDDAIFIPSSTDLLSIPTIPRPIFPYNSDQILSSDPTFITVKGDLEITATANDLQMLIGQQYNGHGSKREEIPKQIAHQCSACPAMDSTVQIQYLSSLVPESTPHIFLSSTIFFDLISNIDGTNVIYVRQYIKSLSFTVINVKGNEITAEVKKDFNQ